MLYYLYIWVFLNFLLNLIIIFFFFFCRKMMLTGIILLENLKWLLPTTFMIGAAPAYITIWAGWRAISAVLPRWVYVKGDDFLFSTYHRNLLFFFETLTGVEVSFICFFFFKLETCVHFLSLID